MVFHSQYWSIMGGRNMRQAIPPIGITIDITPPDFTAAEMDLSDTIDITAPDFTDAEMDTSDTIDITEPDYTAVESDHTLPISLSYAVT